MGRQYLIRVIPARTAEAIEAEVNQDPMFVLEAPTRRTINGHQVDQYAMSGLCGTPSMEVITGKDYNLDLRSNCGGDDFTEEFALFEDLVESLTYL
jgi:hypothetical protein